MSEQPNYTPPASKPRISLKAMALTLILVLFNIAVYFYQIAFASPLESRESNLLLFGANIYQLSLTGDWWRYPISMILHSDAMHIGFNSLALLVIGIECERVYGKFKLLSIYIISGIGAALFSAYWQYQESLKAVDSFSLYMPINNTVYITIGVGASGAIMGLAAASVIYLLKTINSPDVPDIENAKLKRQLYNIIAMIALTLVNGMQSGVDNAAHVGGAVIGALVSLGYVISTKKSYLIDLLITVIAAALLIFAIYSISFSTDEDLLFEREFIYQEIQKEVTGANQ
ncbi:rhomboid family intramembrane serine protease [Providencia manganoxydans]|uniref:rhomboid family intramembrane serine protease n=1 Tax=Providencia manganoxydans TaxID=2923283 RepID=UPI0034E4C59B